MGNNDMRIMSFNIRNDFDKGTESWASRRDDFFKLIKNAAPDIMGFQEVSNSQYTDLNDNLPEYGSIGVGRNDGAKSGEYAAVFYREARFTAIGTGNFWLSETPDRPSLGWDAACIRICTYARLLDNETRKELMFFNTHLDHVGKIAVAESVKMIRKAVFDKKMPALITGDFNAGEESEPYRIMTQKGLSDAKFTAKSSMVYGTFHGFKPGASIQNESPIDYIFHTDDDFIVESYKVLVNGGEGAFTSDHYPVLATLSQV